MPSGEATRNKQAKPSRRSRPKKVPNSLPVPRTSFIGRVREISEVRRLVTSNRLLTLTGPGGCGKTRLAIAVAEKLLHSALFQHGIHFVELAGLDNSQLVSQLVATTIGIPEASEQPLIRTLVDSLQSKKTLLILDNCEHLLPACRDLAQTLLEACADLHFLATSREPLNLSLETIWLVPSMALPAADALRDPEQLTQSEAIQLFVARASIASPGFAIVEANAAAVEKICRRLDGIPLAIELAAARIKMLDVVQIANRLEDSLRLLTRSGGGSAPRHQTMRAALDWSYALLLPHEQRLFQRLAVFGYSFTLEAVEAICTDAASDVSGTGHRDGVSSSEILDLLSNLIDKSLVMIAERASQGTVRYRLLEPIRQFALDRLRETGAEAQARERHLAYFVHFAEQAEPQLKSSNQLAWLERLDREHDNLRAALTWSSQDKSRNVLGLRLGIALHLFWQRRSYGIEGRRWLQEAIANFDALADTESLDLQRYLARALVAQEWLAIHQGDYGAANENLNRGLALAQGVNDPIVKAHALTLQAIVSEFAGETSAAHQQTIASIDNAERSGDKWSLALAGHYYGRALYHNGDEAAARSALRKSEALFRETGDQWSVASILDTLAAMAGEPDSARALYEQALPIFQELGHQEAQMRITSNLAGLALIQGDIQRAEELYQRVLAEARELGIKATVAFCLRGLGRVHILQGDFDAAEQLLREGMTLDKETGHQIWFALSLAGWARIAAARGTPLQAARMLGAIDAFLVRNSIHLDADDSIELKQHDAVVRGAATAEEFESNYLYGQTLSLEQVAEGMTTLAPDRMNPLTIPARTTDSLQLYALSPTRVLLGDRPITDWSYARVKELLFYLVSHPARTKAQIGLTLWPEASPAQLRNSLATALYHLRRALGKGEWIVFEDHQYRFNRALAYRFDVEIFEAKLEQAARLQKQVPEQASSLLEQALALYQGDFVEDFLEGEWFLLRREELRRKYLDGLLALGQLFFEQGDYARAAGVYHQVIEKDIVMEAAHRAMMRSYARLGERGQALRQYEMLEKIMRQELGSRLAAESAALYEQLKRGEKTWQKPRY